MAVSITDVLNTWNQIGVFSYLIPFLLIFAVVFAVLEKSGVLSRQAGTNENPAVEHNKALLAIISISIAALSLQFDLVSEFFAIIFPRFGIGLSIFLVILILAGFFYTRDLEGSLGWIGWTTGIGAVIWALVSWDDWGLGGGIGWWIQEYFWAIVILGVFIWIIYMVASDPMERKTRRRERLGLPTS